MNYGQVRDASLHLLNRFSIAGTGIAVTYNNQADTLAAIPSLVDSAQMEIATTVRPIIVMKKLTANRGLFHLPNDCCRFIGLEPNRNWQFIGERFFRVPGWKGDWIMVKYHRYPRSVGQNPDDNKRLDNTPDTHQAIPYYVASHLALDDDTYKYSTLYNEWRTKLTELAPPVRVETEVRHNVYEIKEPV